MNRMNIANKYIIFSHLELMYNEIWTSLYKILKEICMQYRLLLIFMNFKVDPYDMCNTRKSPSWI